MFKCRLFSRLLHAMLHKLVKSCVIIHGTKYDLFKSNLSGKTYNFRQKIFDKWIHQQWKMFDSQRWKIFDTKIFDRKFSTLFFPVENIPPLIKRNSKMFHHTVENIPMTKIAQRIF